MAFENFPYSNFHEINLDWIIAKVKEAYSASNPPDYPVTSVNGQTGDVVIAIPSALVRTVNGESGDVILYRNPLVQFPTTEDSRWNLFRICDGDSGDARGIEFDENGAHRIEGVRRILIYDEENQPDFPVTSVNGQTGDVHITAGVNSVNGKTGNVVTPFINPNTDILKLDSNSNTILWGISRDVTGGNIALYISSGAGSPQAFIRYTPTEGEPINLPLLTNADIPESAGVVSVNGKTGAVTLYGTDILTTENGRPIPQDIRDLNNALNNTAQVVYKTEISSLVGRIPFHAKNGDSITIRTKNGSNFIAADQLRFYDASRSMIQYWATAPTTVNSRTFTYNEETEALYIGIEKVSQSVVDYIIENNSNDYNFESTIENAQNSISQMQTEVENIEEQMSALQTSDTNQSQQITALQTSDTNQSQQITALQADDSAHAQQIAELQSADATHNQQITDLYNASVTQGNQINDLYTRTGVYTIYIENVNSLPLRYPASGTDPKIKSTNMVVSMDMNIPGVQVNDWTITTYDGYLEITGTLNGTVTLTLFLA